MDAGDYYKRIHSECRHNEMAVQDSWFCGCFYCISTFHPTEVVDWLDEREYNPNSTAERTAVCPRCCIDSVLPRKEYYEITDELLENMHAIFFTVPKTRF